MAATASAMFGKAKGSANDLRDALAGIDAGALAAAGGEARLAGESGVLSLMLREVRDASADLMMQTQILGGGFAMLDGRLSDVVAHLAAVDAAVRGTGDAMTGLAVKSAAAGTTAAAAGNAYRIWGTGIRLTGNAIHWLVMGTLEVASTAIPAIVALGAAGAGMFDTFVHISDTISFLVTASGSMSGAMRNSVGPVSALSQHVGSLAAAMAPDAYIIFGSVIQDLTGSFGSFSGVAQQAGNALAGFATKITQDLHGGAGTQLAGFFQNSVKYMIQWGQVLGNLGHAFLNVMTSMFGVGQVLLDVLVVLSRAFLALTSNPVAAWLIGVTAAMSALYRYSRLMVTVFSLLGGSALVNAIKGAAGYASALAALAAEEGVVAAASLAMGDLMSVALGPVGIAIAAVTTVLGLWYLASRSSSDATTQLIANVEKAPPTVQNLTSGITRLNTALMGQEKNMHAVSQAAKALSTPRGGSMAAFDTGTSQQNIDKLTAAIRKQELELLNLDIGLAQTASGTGAVAAGENALAVSTALADSKVSQLNQALDQYMQLVTGGTSGLSQFSESLQNIGHVVADTANHLSSTSGGMILTARQFAAALSHSTGTGAQAWANFDQVLGSTMPQLMDWFREARTLGATTGQAISKAALDMTAEMIKYAGSNKTAQAEVLAFAQAQGLNITSWKDLLAAVKTQGAGQADLAKKVDATTIALGNLTAMARNTSAALNTQVSNALATAALKASHFQTYVTNAAQAMADGGQYGGRTYAYWLGLADQASKSAGADAITMAQQVVGASGQLTKAGARIAGSANTAAGALANAAQQARNLATAIDALHSKTIYIDVVQEGAGLNIPGGGGLRITGGSGASGAVPHARGGTARRGMALVGEEGPELMWMRGGEQVLPAGPTKALMHMAKSMHGAHGYAGGTSEFTKLLHLLERDFRLIENGLRVQLKRPEGVWFPSLIKAVEEIKRDFGKHLITKQEELRLLRLAESRNKRLEGIAVHHAESRDLGKLLGLFSPHPHKPAMLGPIADLLQEVQKAHGAGVIGKQRETWLTGLLERDNKKLEGLVHERARIGRQITAEENRIKAHMAAMRQYASSVTSTAMQSASLSSVMQTAGGGPVSSAYLLASLKLDLTSIRRFSGDIRKLKALGLDKNLLNQIIQLGPVTGDQAAQALINGPLSEIKALNRTESQIGTASKALGKTAETEMYGTGKDFGKGVLRGLEAEQKNLEKLMDKIAKSMVATLRRELGLDHRGPAHKTGHDVMAAVAAGITGNGPALTSALRTAAGHVPSALASAAGVSGGTQRIDLTINNTCELDGKTVWRSTQKQALIVNRRHPNNRMTITRGRG